MVASLSLLPPIEAVELIDSLVDIPGFKLDTIGLDEDNPDNILVNLAWDDVQDVTSWKAYRNGIELDDDIANDRALSFTLPVNEPIGDLRVYGLNVGGERIAATPRREFTERFDRPVAEIAYTDPGVGDEVDVIVNWSPLETSAVYELVHYELFRDGISIAQVEDLISDPVTYTDSSLPPGQMLSYEIVAVYNDDIANDASILGSGLRITSAAVSQFLWQPVQDVSLILAEGVVNTDATVTVSFTHILGDLGATISAYRAERNELAIPQESSTVEATGTKSVSFTLAADEELGEIKIVPIDSTSNPVAIASTPLESAEITSSFLYSAPSDLSVYPINIAQGDQQGFHVMWNHAAASANVKLHPGTDNISVEYNLQRTAPDGLEEQRFSPDLSAIASKANIFTIAVAAGTNTFAVRAEYFEDGTRKIARDIQSPVNVVVPTVSDYLTPIVLAVVSTGDDLIINFVARAGVADEHSHTYSLAAETAGAATVAAAGGMVIYDFGTACNGIACSVGSYTLRLFEHTTATTGASSSPVTDSISALIGIWDVELVDNGSGVAVQTASAVALIEAGGGDTNPGGGGGGGGCAIASVSASPTSIDANESNSSILLLLFAIGAMLTFIYRDFSLSSLSFVRTIAQRSKNILLSE